MANRGYSGYYNGVYLRSSYEYAYALYLDANNISWKYEQQVFDINNKKYKPDFFLYNQLGKLVKIVEVKSRNIIEIEKAFGYLAYLKENYNLDVELVSYEQLKEIYKKMPITLNKALTSWVNSKETSISKDIYKELNPHFGMKHLAKTKEIIGQKTKARWNDDVLKNKMIEGAKKGGLRAKEVLTGVEKVERVSKECQYCSGVFKVLKTSTQQYCSNHCSSASKSKLANETFMKNRSKVHDEVREFIYKWSKDNKSILLNTPYNKISSNLRELLIQIENEFNIKDLRVISKIMLGEDLGRKALLDHLKQN